jgi:type IV pilus assembly protein PilA
MVVVIVGVLALLAVWGMRRHLTNAKAAEVRVALPDIAKAAVMAYEKDTVAPSVLAPGASTPVLHRLCPGSGASVPASPEAIRGKKYPSTSRDWADHPSFRCLGFTLQQPQYYMYSYETTGSGTALGDGFVATGRGDLDGDGTLSTFLLRGTLQAGRVVDVAPSLEEEDPDE